MGLANPTPPLAVVTGATRQKLIHIHQSIFAASNSKQVYCILNNWCICKNLSCGGALFAH